MIQTSVELPKGAQVHHFSPSTPLPGSLEDPGAKPQRLQGNLLVHSFICAYMYVCENFSSLGVGPQVVKGLLPQKVKVNRKKKTIISHIGRSAMQDHFTSPLYENPMKGDESSSDSSSCHHCQHRRRISCWTVPTKMQLKLHFRKTCHVLHFYILCPEVLSLLAVDLFTILLIFVIATQSNQMPMGETFEF